MIPTHEFLARVRWDPAFGRGKWEIACLDRAQPTLVHVPLDQVNDAPHTGHAFEVVDEEGVTHTIPYHRVRQVWRDGDLVWSRLAPRVPKKVQKPRPARREREAQPRMRR